jgi:8-oxo-dGTP pyrophosphatase MutT (NUDIX family)
MKVLKDFIFTFARELLEEAGISDEAVQNDLESLVYEAGMRRWEEDGDYYYIDEDDY